MAFASGIPPTGTATSVWKPRDDQVDAFGMTHRGPPAT
jgi:hypothetical protein